MPIRNEKMEAMPGVSIREMGVKFGLNGVDNAALLFKDVRIPRTYMMNKYHDVDENGVFRSETKNIYSRFFMTTERLLAGRVCIAAMTLGALRSCLYITIKYSQQRKSIGPDGESSVAIFDYQLQQNTLMPLMAKMFSLNMLYNYVRDVFANPKLVGGELLSICCIVKTMMGWHLEKTASTCRERSGGQGYLAVNRFIDYIALAHAGMTAEGDNRILMTKIVKDMITRHIKEKKPLPTQKYNPKTQLASFMDVT